MITAPGPASHGHSQGRRIGTRLRNLPWREAVKYSSQRVPPDQNTGEGPAPLPEDTSSHT
jgi:hypothetical protein